MHPNNISEEISMRMQLRRGRSHLFDTLKPKSTALIIVDMQNAFLELGAPSETPMAREIVPNINRLSACLRSLGGIVAFTQGTFQKEGVDSWPMFFNHMVNADYADAILKALTPGQTGHNLWPLLDVMPQDIIVHKKRYSAFYPGACTLPEQLRAKGIDTVVITGTLTNVCCESSARDAMMDGYKTVVVSDGNAARSDKEHLASLETLFQFFADIRTTEELLEMWGCVPKIHD